MSIFKKDIELPPTIKKRAKKKDPGNKTTYTEGVTKINYTEKQMEVLDTEFDYKDMDPSLILFTKYYIMNGGNGTAAYMKMRNGNITYNSAHVGANRYLRKLRSNAEFFDLIGLGYNDLKEVIDLLKIKKPEVAAAIMMKVLKEDQIDINLSGNMKIEFEKDLDSE